MGISRLMMPAVTLAGALALAGCGGGNDNRMDGKEEMGNGKPVTCNYGRNADQSCKTKAAFDAEQKEKTDAAAAVTAAQARAKALHGLLDHDNVKARAGDPDTSVASANVVTAIGKAEDASDGMGSEMKAMVRVMDNKGAMVDSETIPAAFDVDNANGIAEYVAGSGFATGQEKKTHKNTDKITGTYAGAAGKYTCGDANCTSQVGHGGIVLSGAWTWQADLNTPKYRVKDPNYAEFGWWLDEDIADGDDKVGTWYSIQEVTDNVTPASGSATYSGNAVGQAAFYDVTTESENIGGAFTADVSLTADFDDNELSGTVDNFDIGGVKPEWEVELMKAGIESNGRLSTSAAVQTKWTVDGTAGDPYGGNNNAAGWRASFYDMPTDERTPRGVGGGFVARHGSEGRMVGAFGAER